MTGRLAFAGVLVALTVAANASGMEPVAADAALDLRIKKLESELRCLVCQNQTLADSNAELADDLRREVRGLAQEGKSDQEIKAYLVARYGDFVLYNPPVKATTWLLWGGPFALLLGGAALWWGISRRAERVMPSSSATDAEAIARARLEMEHD